MRYSDVCGEKVSMLGMGCMRLPVKKGSIIRSIDYVEGKRVIDYAMEHGINYFDTAYIYHLGKSETFLAKALQDYPRESYFLADKFHIMTNPSYKHVFKRQLKKLRTDYIDFYLAHGIMDFTYRSYIQSGCVEWLMEQKERGRIKHLGFSSHASPGSLRKFCEYADWDFVQLQINYMDWQFGTAREQYEIACEFGLPVIVMEPVKGGRLVSLGEQPDAMLKGRDPEHSIPSWAMRFLMGLPQVKVVLSGMGSLGMMEDNVDTFSNLGPLSEDDLKLLMNASKLAKRDDVLPCTACRYCCSSCPKKIDIPDILERYNSLNTKRKTLSEALEGIPDGHGPSDCIGCGACARQCPQGIDIPSAMADFASKK